MLLFDDVIPLATDIVKTHLKGRDTDITFVRDVEGQVWVVLEKDVLDDEELAVLASSLDRSLGHFSPGQQQVLLRRTDLIDEADVLQSPDRAQLPESGNVWLVDRLMTNQDWLRGPFETSLLPLPVGVAFSLKGGVGRSTALATWAWHLAREGRRVVAIDLDLEAPGLGSLLLKDLPSYGAVDWLVESLLEPPAGELLDDSLAFSPITEEAEGVVQVLPAFGAKTSNYVAKIGRVYFPVIGSSGREVGLAERVRQLVRAIAARNDPPDVVLIDSRAGLHDVGAAAVTQLGAEVLIFARDEPQSWQTLCLLFEHLSRSARVQFGMPESDLRWRLKMVAAQVGRTQGDVTSWLDSSYDTWSALYDEVQEGDPGTFVRDDANAPHYPFSVYFDGNLRGMQLAHAEQRPAWAAIEAAFGEFLAGASARLLGHHVKDGGGVPEEE